MDESQKTRHMEKYTIEQLSKRECAAKNDGTLEQIQELMDVAFPADGWVIQENGVIRDRKFFFANANCMGHWMVRDETDLPTQSVKDFLTEILKTKNQKHEKKIHN